jgi:hypothetical protein
VLRFINASPLAGTYDFGTGTDSASLLITGAAFSTFGNASNADSAGFVPFTSDGGVYIMDVSQLNNLIQPIENVTMTAGFGYSFFYGTDQNGGGAYAFFCNDIGSFAPYTSCFWPDGGLLTQ